MSVVQFKFSSNVNLQSVSFDGASIAVIDLKKAIMEKLKLKASETGLSLTNRDTLKVYKKDTALVPKNSTVLVCRVPSGNDPKSYYKNKSGSSYPIKSTKAYPINNPIVSI